MKLLCVCTGNICRSPMLEELLRREFEKLGVTDISVSSAGVGTYDGASASEHAVTVMKELGFDISKHRSRQVTPAIVADTDVFIALSPEHGVTLAFQYGADPEKILTVGAGIPDPYGRNLATYRSCVELLVESLPQLIEDVKAL